MSRKNLQITICTMAGSVRSINQDNFYCNGMMRSEDGSAEYTTVCETDRALLAVADGMGGEHDGELASLAAVCALRDIGQEQPSYQQLCDCVTAANAAICQKSEQTRSRMGTTIVIAVVKGKRLHIYNIGDSKAFLYHDGHLTQLSKDHTAAASLIEAGLITPEEARLDPRNHQLSQHLGISPEEMQLSLYRRENVPFQKGDVLLLCSDGLTDGLDNEAICHIIAQQPDRPDLAADLAAAALQAGSHDNITALTVFQHRTHSFLFF